MSMRIRSILMLANRTVFAKPCHLPRLSPALSAINTNYCSKRLVQTQGDKELCDFLEKEIKAELKNKKSASSKIADFDVKTNSSDVTFSKKLNDETISIKMNVNHSVDAEEPQEETASTNQEPESGAMKSKPNFTVEITKDGKTLSVSCSYPAYSEEEGEEYNDSFQIDELSIFEGKFTDQSYSVSGDIMDGFLYDLLINMLEERGVSNDFADKLVDYCTAHEHGLYITFLEQLKGFTSK